MKTRDGQNVRLQADADTVVLIVNNEVVFLTKGEFSLLIARPEPMKRAA